MIIIRKIWTEPASHNQEFVLLICRGVFVTCFGPPKTRNMLSNVSHILIILTYYSLTHSIQHSPSWEANHSSTSQEIPPILGKTNVHYRTHKCPPPVPILSQLDPVHTPTSYFLMIHLNIILPNSLLTSGFPTKTPSTRYMPRPSHFLYFITRTIFGEQYSSLSNTDL